MVMVVVRFEGYCSSFFGSLQLLESVLEIRLNDIVARTSI